MAFDWNKPFQTRDGRPARLEHKLSKPMASGETHLVEVDGDEWEFYFPDGSFDKNQCLDDVVSGWDLVNIPEKKVVERWVVLNSDGESSTYKLEAYAQKNMHDWRQMGLEARIHHIREEF